MMNARTLCDGGLAVQVTGAGNRAALMVVDGIAVKFECYTRLLKAVLEGAPLQVSAKEGFCLLERRGNQIRLEFGISGEGRQTCEFPAEEFATALAEIEAREAPLQG
ncbi:MAG: hypothetical protein ACO1SV_27045 [Fimbriimonas sp.]